MPRQPSAYEMSPQMLSRDEATGSLPGWTGGRARLVTGQTGVNKKREAQDRQERT